MAGNTSTPGASVVSRALALLAAFDERHRRLTLTELARRAGPAGPDRPPAGGELVAGGALVRRPRASTPWAGGCGARPARAGADRAPARSPSPFLHDIYAATLATVHLAVRDRTEVLYLDRFRARLGARGQHVGSRLPMYATGVGKVLLAHAPDEVASTVLSPPHPAHAAHRHPAGAAARASSRRCGATATPPRSRR